MYLPPHFAESRPDVLHSLMRSHPLATLVTTSAEGIVANHIPLLLHANEGPHGTLVGHVARSNPLWRDTSGESKVLVIFQGPQSYISPSWYPTKREHGMVVPTWNYTAVHVQGTLRVMDDPQWVLRLVTDLTRTHESGFAAPWAVADAPPDYIAKMLNAIVGIEIPIDSIVGKWKVSQNQPQKNRAGAADGLVAVASEEALQMAQLVTAPAQTL